SLSLSPSLSFSLSLSLSLSSSFPHFIYLFYIYSSGFHPTFTCFTLSCTFWSNEWISDDISITWHFQPERGKDSQHYIDNVGSFKERIEWIGDPRWKDGSIIIHDLEYTDNGTYTCDVKNPPDIVGRTSQVTLYVFENVPTRYGQVLGGIIGGVLAVVLVVLLIAYLIRYCWLRRQATLQRRLR
uniref:Myelin protein zero n=1 Tax=Pseudonaja textilis TaxID=8673 RepID=A0A670YV63_PSETE